MTTDIAVLERALVVMAVCIVLQTLLLAGATWALFVAWRRTSAALAETRRTTDAHIAELGMHLDRISGTVDQVAHALMRGSSAVDEVVSEVRDAMGTVRQSVGSVASVVTAPRAAIALGLWRGIQIWRRHRAQRRVAAAATAEW